MQKHLPALPGSKTNFLFLSMSVVSVSRALGCLTAEASPLLGSRASRERHHDIERKHRASRKKRRGRSPRQPLSRSPGVLARGGAIAERGGKEGRGPPAPTSAGRGPRAQDAASSRARLRECTPLGGPTEGAAEHQQN